MNSYTVRIVGNCRVILGAVPLMDMAILLQGWAELSDGSHDDEWVINAELAERMQATMVCGPRDTIDHLLATWGKEHVETCRPDRV